MKLAKAEDLIKMGFKVEDLDKYANELLDFCKKSEKPTKKKEGNEGKEKKGGK